ncbi:MAG: hypothetical protein WCF25_09020 [Acidimicrobiales bacterium]
MSNTPAENAFVARLEATPYRDVDEDFIRFRDVPVDDALKSIVTSVVASDDSDRDSFRRALGADEVETLRLYAKRRIVQSRRRSSVNLVDDAFDALALLPETSEVPWDTWLKAGLLGARSLGRDIETIAVRFGEIASVQAAERFDVAFDAMSRVETLEQCFITEVSTTYGTGFIETLVHRDTKATGAFYGAPRQADDIVPFAPTTNLAQLAASLADAYDATEHLHTGAIAQDQLAGMSFSQQVSGAFLTTTGCLSFYADSAQDNKSFRVFVAELPDDVDVEDLASGAELEDQAVCFDDTRLILLLAPPNFEDDEESAFDFSEPVATAQQVLRASLPVGWHNR